MAKKKSRKLTKKKVAKSKSKKAKARRRNLRKKTQRRATRKRNPTKDGPFDPKAFYQEVYSVALKQYKKKGGQKKYEEDINFALEDIQDLLNTIKKLESHKHASVFADSIAKNKHDIAVMEKGMAAKHAAAKAAGLTLHPSAKKARRKKKKR